MHYFCQALGIKRDLSISYAIPAVGIWPVQEISLFDSVSGKEFSFWRILPSESPLFGGDPYEYFRIPHLWGSNDTMIMYPAFI